MFWCLIYNWKGKFFQQEPKTLNFKYCVKKFKKNSRHYLSIKDQNKFDKSFLFILSYCLVCHNTIRI